MDTAEKQNQAAPSNLPPGDHPLEEAARRGFGPLSLSAREIWHGGAKPCVTCGQLVRREAPDCDHCGQDLSPAMIQRMLAHAGPWYVLEHVRPFPGVSLERIIRQVHRGLITETSIVRGPATDYQWRFAVETPGLCRMFRKCWNCHGSVALAEIQCRTCGASLSFEIPVSQARTAASVSTATQRTPAAVLRATAGPADGGDGRALALLQEAVQAEEASAPTGNAGDVMKLAGVRVAWIAVGIVVAVFSALVWITSLRDKQLQSGRQNLPLTPSVTPPTPSPQAQDQG